jgi:hypothetical protein
MEEGMMCGVGCVSVAGAEALVGRRGGNAGGKKRLKDTSKNLSMCRYVL